MPSVLVGGVATLVVVGAVALLAPELRRLDLGRRLIEAPGVPLAGAAAGTNIAAADVDFDLASALDPADPTDRSAA